MIEKFIKVGEKDVGFKCPASFPIRYKAKYDRDFFEDIVKLSEVAEDGNMSAFASIIYEMAHLMAKSYNPSLPDKIEDWLDTMDEFPVFDMAVEIIKFANESVISKKAEETKKNAVAAETTQA